MTKTIVAYLENQRGRDARDTFGAVWLVGAGPGHPGLLTVLGREVLARADVVVHDRLGCEEILQELPHHVRLVDVGKMPGRPKLAQDGINELLAREAAAGARVVRLKGGDPFVFGRGMEELLYLRERGVPCHVVPGISSATAGPAWAGIPMTHRAVSRGFTIGTGRAEDGHTPRVNDGDTRVYLMAMGAMDEVVSQLLNQGVAPETPAAVITDATTYRQRSVRGTLATIGAISREAGLNPPGLLVIGATAGLLADEAPAGRKALLVTSTRIPKAVEELFPGETLVWRPLVKIEALPNAEVHSLDAEWIVFNSRYAVWHFFRALRETGLDARRLFARFAAIGNEAAAALEELHLVADVVAVDGSPAGLGELLQPHIAGKRVLLPCAEEYRGGLARELLDRGAGEVIPLAVYRSLPGRPARVDWHHVDRVFFASPASVDRFREHFPEAPLDELQAVCLGETPTRKAREMGFKLVRDLSEERKAPPQESAKTA